MKRSCLLLFFSLIILVSFSSILIIPVFSYLSSAAENNENTPIGSLTGFVNLIYAQSSLEAGINIPANNEFSIGAASLSVSGCISNSGTLVVSSGSISLNGNWENKGVFAAGNGTVKFTGTLKQNITGDTSFYNFTCTSAGNELDFEAGKTQTIGSIWAITGASGNEIKLRSITGGSQWYVYPQGTNNLSYVDVKDSYNMSGTTLNPSQWTDSGNNTNWGTQTPTPTPTPAITTKPTVSTGDAASVTSSFATLNGTVNANGSETLVWFEYGTASGSYGNMTPTQTVTGSNSNSVIASISSLSVSTKYYYRIAASNAGGTSYGDEKTFTTSTSTSTMTGIIIGTVIDTDTGKGIQGAMVSTGTGGYSATTASSGNYQISDVATGIYILTASATGYNSDSQIITVTANSLLTANFSLEISVSSNTAMVSGTVKDDYGKEFQGVEVTMKGNIYSEQTETNMEGIYRFEEVPAGDYTITFESDGYETQTTDISVTGGMDYEVKTIQMEPDEIALGMIYGVVHNINGDSIKNIKMTLKNIESKDKQTTYTDGDGYFEFEDLEEGIYKLYAKKKHYKKSKKTITINAGQEQYVEIELHKLNKSKGKLVLTDVE